MWIALSDECEEIITAANAATPGRLCAVGVVVENTNDKQPDFCCTDMSAILNHKKTYEQAVADSRFIEAVQPQKIKALLESLMELAEERENIIRELISENADHVRQKALRHLSAMQ